MNYWLVRGSPRENVFAEFMHIGEENSWRTKQPPRIWELGDRLLFWASSPRRELIGLGEFRGLTGERTPVGEIIYNVRYLTPEVDAPIGIDQLRSDRALANAIFLKNGPATSVVRLSPAEGRHLYRRLVSANPEFRGTWQELDVALAGGGDGSTSSESWSAAELLECARAYTLMFRKQKAGGRSTVNEVLRALVDGPVRGHSLSSTRILMRQFSRIVANEGGQIVQAFMPATSVDPKESERIGDALASAEHHLFVPTAPTTDEGTLRKRATALRSTLPLDPPPGIKVPAKQQVMREVFARDPAVRAFVLRAASGSCEMCGRPAPFKLADGSPFLEVHHVRPLGAGGSDTVQNAVAVCPNCHRCCHLDADMPAVMSALYARVRRLALE